MILGVLCLNLLLLSTSVNAWNWPSWDQESRLSIKQESSGLPACPKDWRDGQAICDGPSLETPIILRCENGTFQPGMCTDNLAGYPPEGLKQDARCWQTSNTTGDAACTADCVNVTSAAGETFYPVGCSFVRWTGTAPPVLWPSRTNEAPLSDAPAQSEAPGSTSDATWTRYLQVGWTLAVVLVTVVFSLVWVGL